MMAMPLFIQNNMLCVVSEGSKQCAMENLHQSIGLCISIRFQTAKAWLPAFAELGISSWQGGGYMCYSTCNKLRDIDIT